MSMAKEVYYIGDEVRVYLGNGGEPFAGIVIVVSKEVAKDVWYKVRPLGKEMVYMQSHWYRESHVRRMK